MNPSSQPTHGAAPAASAVWTCPFCALLCEDVGRPAGAPAALPAGSCPRAAHALAKLSAPATPGCRVDGASSSTEAALDTAAERLARWRQPLFAGLGADIAGARAAYRLAARCGAILDHADGPALMHGLRALQDRGQYVATMAELRSRAELIVLVGTPGTARFPEFFRRAGIGDPAGPCTRLVFLGAAPAQVVPKGRVAVDTIAADDLFESVQQLAALATGQRVHAPHEALVALTEHLRASRYAVLVWEGAALPREGALIVEALNRIVGILNKTTRAATFGLGGSDGGHSANQTVTWLSGLPLRTRVSAGALQHEPQRYDTAALVAQRAVDGMLWISAFDPARLPPGSALPRIVLGPPAMAAALPAGDAVFIPVATPGFNAAGHLFRTDGPVVLPLHAARDDGLPGVAAVLDGLLQRIAR